MLLILAISCVTAISLLCLNFISIGKYVQVIASTAPSTVSMGCSLKDVYLLGSSDIESSESIGDRVIVVRVFNGQDGLFTIERANITNYIGYYVINSPTLPAEVSLNSELHVEIQMIDSVGNILAEDETTILYK